MEPNAILTDTLRALNQTLQSMRMSIEEIRRQPVSGGFMSSFTGRYSSVIPEPMSARSLWSPDVIQAYPRIGFGDLLYRSFLGVPMARSYITPSENLYMQDTYMRYMLNPGNVLGWGMQGAGFALGLLNPWLGISVGLAGSAINAFISNYLIRFPELERTRQVLGVHFQDFTRIGYKGMDFETASRVNSAIIDAALSSATYGISEMRDLAAKLSQTNLLSGIKTVEEFKTRFKSLVDNIREITGALHISHEEAIGMLQEMQRMGFSPGQVSTFAYQMRNTAAALGVNPAAYSQNVASMTTALVNAGYSPEGAMAISNLPGFLLSAAKYVMRPEDYARSGIVGRQDVLLEQFSKLSTTLLPNASFQFALLGANQLINLGGNLGSADFTTLMQYGMGLAGQRPELFYETGRRLEVSRLLSQNPALFYEALNKYVEFRSMAYPGVSDRSQARRMALMDLGITNPEYATALLNVLENVPSGGALLFGRALNLRSEIEKNIDETIYRQQDTVASWWKNFVATINIFSKNWVGWRAIHERMTQQITSGNNLIYNALNDFFGSGENIINRFLAPYRGQAGIEAFFGPEGLAPLRSTQDIQEIMSLMNVRLSPAQFTKVLGTALGAKPGEIYTGLAVMTAYSALSPAVQAMRQELQRVGFKGAQLDQMQVLLSAGSAFQTYLPQGELEKQRQRLEESIRQNQVITVKIAEDQEIKINREQWNSLSDQLKNALSSMSYIMSTNQIELLNRIAAHLSKKEELPAEQQKMLSQLELAARAYNLSLTSDELQTLSSQFSQWFTSTDTGMFYTSFVLSQYKDKITPEVAQGILKGDYTEAAKAGIPFSVAIALREAWMSTSGTANLPQQLLIPGMQLYGGLPVPRQYWKYAEAVNQHGHESSVLAQSNIPLDKLLSAWRKIRQTNPKLAQAVKRIIDENGPFLGPYKDILSQEEIELAAFLTIPKVRQTVMDLKDVKNISEEQLTERLIHKLSGDQFFETDGGIVSELAGLTVAKYPGIVKFRGTKGFKTKLTPEALSIVMGTKGGELEKIFEKFLSDQFLEFNEFDKMISGLAKSSDFKKYLENILGVTNLPQKVVDVLAGQFVQLLPYLPADVAGAQSILKQNLAEAAILTLGGKSGLSLQIALNTGMLNEKMLQFFGLKEDKFSRIYENAISLAAGGQKFLGVGKTETDLTSQKKIMEVLGLTKETSRIADILFEYTKDKTFTPAEMEQVFKSLGTKEVTAYLTQLFGGDIVKQMTPEMVNLFKGFLVSSVPFLPAEGAKEFIKQGFVGMLATSDKYGMQDPVVQKLLSKVGTLNQSTLSTIGLPENIIEQLSNNVNSLSNTFKETTTKLDGLSSSASGLEKVFRNMADRINNLNQQIEKLATNVTKLPTSNEQQNTSEIAKKVTSRRF